MATTVMDSLFSSHAAQRHPVRSLSILFILWKGFLVAIALGASLFPAYDTSTSLFIERMYGRNASISTLATQLTRWDALYFMHAAIKGQTVYEQEWAFGMGFPSAIRLLKPSGISEPVVAIAMTHAAHYIAALCLYRLTLLLWTGNRRLAFLSAALHILSPAGLFLSAPYNESPFACLCFLGNLLFGMGIGLGSSRDDACGQMRAAGTVVASGLVFGLATTFRSNGLSSGLMFAAEAAIRLHMFVQWPPRRRHLVAVGAAGVGGLFVAAGSLVPQTLAWKRYCTSPSPMGSSSSSSSSMRPWCQQRIPSIYTFVQEHYWNVGFMRYWTWNQVPLFLLATPMLVIMIKSGLDVLRTSHRTATIPVPDWRTMGPFVGALAASQVLVAVLAITTYHVQIITRISSGYPVWYWWVAACLMDKKRERAGSAIVVFMVMYAGIQGGLFASFLPPA
ncbi:GPI mannosyltransferase 2-like protein [Moelleriella libera RCEF 2490]|uniref:GPI mannosyltransferase 2 n=1 Tax=Moelleriella libera RCEF 2490 TaxID=1081109 RepID=A0A166PHL1_9HYPO|nr:GPI mannosyltransferase 2-like protein [Moelleriella libera RCEF 2490]